MNDNLLTVSLDRGSYLIIDMDVCFPASKTWIRDIFRKWVFYLFDQDAYDQVSEKVIKYLDRKISDYTREYNTFINKESLSAKAYKRLIDKYTMNRDLWTDLIEH